MISVSKTAASTSSSSTTLIDRYVSKIVIPSMSTIAQEKDVLRCTSECCSNRVICRCGVCLEHLCYDHAYLHRHSMTNLEIIK